MMHMMGSWNNETGQWSIENRPEAPTGQNFEGINSNKPNDSFYLLSAASYAPNLLGVKGLNHEIGEWVHKEQVESSEELSITTLFAVVGGVEGAPEDKASWPAVVERFPWEGFEEIGFRTVKSAVSNPSAKPAEKK
jgi:hypothetical protein